MNVLFLTHYTSLYGANRSLLNLIDGITSYGVKPHVICRQEGEVCDVLRRKKAPVAVIPFANWANTRSTYYDAARRVYRNLRQVSSIIKQCKNWNIELIYTNSAVIPVGAPVARLMRLPHVWHLREMVDLDYDLQFDLGKEVFRYVVSKADARIAVSKAVRDHLLGSRRADGSYVVYNGIAFEEDFDRMYEMRKAQRTGKQPFTFAIVGMVYRNKGQEEAIRAMSLVTKRYPNVRLLVVGGGEIDACRKLSDSLCLNGKVDFWGYVENPYTAYMAADVLLMCSRNEGMGRVTAEAMSACLPVIGFDNAGTAEIVRHEQTGLLYKGDETDLAACMARLIENPEWARELGRRGWQVARDKYTIESYSRQIFRIINSLLSGSNSRPDEGLQKQAE